MKNEFPQEYEQIGSPSIGFFSFKQVKAGFSFLKFLFKGDHKKLGSPFFVLGNILLVSYITILISIVVYFYAN